MMPPRFGHDLVLLSLSQAWQGYTVSQALMRRWLRQAICEGICAEQIAAELKLEVPVVKRMLAVVEKRG